jgi:hypothetical protein
MQYALTNGMEWIVLLRCRRAGAMEAGQAAASSNSVSGNIYSTSSQGYLIN